MSDSCKLPFQEILQSCYGTNFPCLDPSVAGPVLAALPLPVGGLRALQGPAAQGHQAVLQAPHQGPQRLPQPLPPAGALPAGPGGASPGARGQTSLRQAGHPPPLPELYIKVYRHSGQTDLGANCFGFWNFFCFVWFTVRTVEPSSPAVHCPGRPSSCSSQPERPASSPRWTQSA